MGRLLRTIGAGGLLALLLALHTGGAAASDHTTQTPGEVRTVPAVDLNRYLGEWYEVARLPNRFQTDCTADVRATYTRRTDGRLDVLNRCATARGLSQALGVARVTDPGTNARLKVRFAPSFLSFLPMVWGDYWILGLSADYAWAVVGSPDRKYLWILSRTPALTPAQYDAALAVARENRFPVENLRRTAQTIR